MHAIYLLCVLRLLSFTVCAIAVDLSDRNSTLHARDPDAKKEDKNEDPETLLRPVPTNNIIPFRSHAQSIGQLQRLAQAAAEQVENLSAQPEPLGNPRRPQSQAPYLTSTSTLFESRLTSWSPREFVEEDSDVSVHAQFSAQLSALSTPTRLREQSPPVQSTSRRILGRSPGRPHPPSPPTHLPLPRPVPSKKWPQLPIPRPVPTNSPPQLPLPRPPLTNWSPREFVQEDSGVSIYAKLRALSAPNRLREGSPPAQSISRNIFGRSLSRIDSPPSPRHLPLPLNPSHLVFGDYPPRFAPALSAPASFQASRHTALQPASLNTGVGLERRAPDAKNYVPPRSVAPLPAHSIPPSSIPAPPTLPLSLIPIPFLLPPPISNRPDHANSDHAGYVPMRSPMLTPPMAFPDLPPPTISNHPDHSNSANIRGRSPDAKHYLTESITESSISPLATRPGRYILRRPQRAVPPDPSPTAELSEGSVEQVTEQSNDSLHNMQRPTLERRAEKQKSFELRPTSLPSPTARSVRFSSPIPPLNREDPISLQDSGEHQIIVHDHGHLYRGRSLLTSVPASHTLHSRWELKGTIQTMFRLSCQSVHPIIRCEEITVCDEDGEVVHSRGWRNSVSGRQCLDRCECIPNFRDARRTFQPPDSPPRPRHSEDYSSASHDRTRFRSLGTRGTNNSHSRVRNYRRDDQSHYLDCSNTNIVSRGKEGHQCVEFVKCEGPDLVQFNGLKWIWMHCIPRCRCRSLGHASQPASPLLLPSKSKSANKNLPKRSGPSPGRGLTVGRRREPEGPSKDLTVPVEEVASDSSPVIQLRLPESPNHRLRCRESYIDAAPLVGTRCEDFMACYGTVAGVLYQKVGPYRREIKQICKVKCSCIRKDLGDNSPHLSPPPRPLRYQSSSILERQQLINSTNHFNSSLINSPQSPSPPHILSLHINRIGKRATNNWRAIKAYSDKPSQYYRLSCAPSNIFSFPGIGHTCEAFMGCLYDRGLLSQVNGPREPFITAHCEQRCRCVESQRFNIEISNAKFKASVGTQMRFKHAKHKREAIPLPEPVPLPESKPEPEPIPEPKPEPKKYEEPTSTPPTPYATALAEVFSGFGFRNMLPPRPHGINEGIPRRVGGDPTARTTSLSARWRLQCIPGALGSHPTSAVQCEEVMHCENTLRRAHVPRLSPSPDVLPRPIGPGPSSVRRRLLPPGNMVGRGARMVQREGTEHWDIGHCRIECGCYTTDADTIDDELPTESVPGRLTRYEEGETVSGRLVPLGL